MCLEASLKQYLNSFKNEKAPEAFQRTFLTKQKKKLVIVTKKLEVPAALSHKIETIKNSEFSANYDRFLCAVFL